MRLTDVAVQIRTIMKEQDTHAAQPPTVRTKPKFKNVACFTDIFPSCSSDRRGRAANLI